MGWSKLILTWDWAAKLYISSGLHNWITLIKDDKLSSGVPCRFYSDDYPEKFRHKYFLVTAGHYYKKMDIRQQMGLGDDVLVFGDSGGYQIATGALKYSDDLREKIFHWLEANSDVAANLDIAPKTVYEN